MQKFHGLIGLFLMLVVIIAVSPRFINNIYDTILGRFVLLGVVIFFTAHNTTLGLLVALCLIVVSNKYLIEGNENMSDSMDAIKKEEDEKKETDKEEDLVGGGDPIIASESIQPLDSSTVPVSKDVFKSDDVKPVTSSSKDGFSLMYSEI